MLITVLIGGVYLKSKKDFTIDKQVLTPTPTTTLLTPTQIITPKYSVPIQLIVKDPFAEGKMAYNNVARVAKSLRFVNTHKAGKILKEASTFQTKFNFCVSSQLYGDSSSTAPTYSIWCAQFGPACIQVL